MGALIIMLLLLGIIYYSANSISSDGSSRNSPAPAPRPAQTPTPAPAPAPEIKKYDKDFLALCSSGTAEAVQAAIPSLKDAHEKDNTGKINMALSAALIAAAMNNSDEGVFKALIDAGADVKMKTSDGRTALLTAITNPSRNPKIIDVLISAGSDVNVRDNENSTPLMIAAMHPFDNSRVIKTLINAGADVEATQNLAFQDNSGSATYNALTYAIASGNAQNVRAIIEAGADVNKQLKGSDLKNGRFVNIYMYPLHDAIGHGIEILKLLLDAGAYVNARNFWGNTPLHHAQMNGKIEEARFLESRGATL